MPKILRLPFYSWHRIAVLLPAALLVQSSTARAQLLERATVIRNARVITEPGHVLEKTTVLIKGDRIEAIGPEVKAPFLSSTLDAGGRTVTAGLIDAWSALGRLGGSDQSDPTSDAWDAFDRYARDDFREALRNGVTTIYLGPPSGPGIGGTGVVVQLSPQGAKAAGNLLGGATALHINLASEQYAVARLKNHSEVRKQFRKALDYRQALEDYDEELKEYLEKLKERREKKEAKDKTAGAAEKKEADKKDEKVKDVIPPPDRPQPPPEEKPKTQSGGTVADAELEPAATNEVKSADEKKDAKAGNEGEKKDADKLTKPTKPAPDRKSEAILRAIDHKLPARVEAHRSEDILNALALAKEFNLNLILEGATDAYLVADNLAEAKSPVVLGQTLRPGVFENNEYRRHSERNAAALEKAGVLWTAGSGAGDPLFARFVAFNAQLAAAAGGGSAWLETVTTRAASVLGLGDRIGRIAVGMRADLVLWTGDPGEPTSRVDRVFVAGQLAYVAAEAQGR